MTYTNRPSLRALTKAIRAPSGDHVGAKWGSTAGAAVYLIDVP